jgi:hypothetical protein
MHRSSGISLVYPVTSRNGQPHQQKVYAEGGTVTTPACDFVR